MARSYPEESERPSRARGPHRVCVRFKEERVLEQGKRIMVTCEEPGCGNWKLRIEESGP